MPKFKKSILTVAMENALAKKNPVVPVNEQPSTYVAENNRLNKIAVLAAAGCVGFLALAWKIETLRNGEGDYETEV